MAKAVKASDPLWLGKKLPRASAQSTSGDSLNLAELRSTVLYFYPKDNTSGCTLEAQDFARLQRKFQSAGFTILGVSRDSIKSHEGFCKKYELPFELLSDPEEKICQAMGVMKEKSMYGRKYMGVERCTFVIDGKGIVLNEWRDVKVKDHAEEVLKFLQEL